MLDTINIKKGVKILPPLAKLSHFKVLEVMYIHLLLKVLDRGYQIEFNFVLIDITPLLFFFKSN